MKYESYVRLKIISYDKTSEQISKYVGLECDRSWRIGDRRGPSIIIEKNNGWVLNSKLPASEDVVNHAVQLLGRLETVSQRIHNLSKVDMIEFSCVIYSSETPAINFSPEISRKVADLGAALDLDIYVG